MRSIHGYVLLVILIFLQIFSLLGLFAFMSVEMALKNTSQEWNKQKQQQIARQLLNQIRISDATPCQIDLMPSSRLMKLPNSWWKEHGCLLQNKYYFLIEKSGNKKYFRVTLVLLPERLNDIKIILQQKRIFG